MLAEKAMHLGEDYQPLLEAAAHNCIDVLESKGRIDCTPVSMFLTR